MAPSWKLVSPRVMVLCCGIGFAALTLLFTYTSFQRTTLSPHTNTKMTYESIAYMDATQRANYTFLDTLLPHDHHNHEFNRGDRTPPWMAHIHQSAAPSPLGLTAQQIQSLADQLVDLPTLDVDAITHYSTDVSTRIQAIINQSMPPRIVYVVCATVQERDAVQKQNTNTNIHPVVLDTQKSYAALFAFARFSITADAVWFVEADDLPRNHLELLLRLGQTDTFRDTLVGWGTSVEADGHDGVRCINEDDNRHVSQAVPMTHKSWLLQHAWLMEPSFMHQPAPVLGYAISRACHAAGIRTVSLPALDAQVSPDAEACTVLEAYLDDALVRTTEAELHWRVEDTLAVKGDPAGMLFAVDDDVEGEDWMTLVCAFQEKNASEYGVHLATTRPAAWTLLAEHFPECASALPVHHVHVMPSSSGVWDHRLAALVSQLQARIVFHLHNETTTTTTVVDASLQSLTEVPVIPFHASDLPSLTWLSDLPLATLEQWQKITVKVLVLTDSKNPGGLERLLKSLETARYIGDKVDLTVLTGSSTDSRTRRVIHDMVWQGTKTVQHRIVPTDRSLRTTEAWYPTSDDEYGLLLEQDMTVAPDFYVWLKYALLKYRYESRTRELYGISLYSPRVAEAGLERRILTPPVESTPYLMQAPCTLGGAVYFPEHWREFHDYMTARLADALKYGLQQIQVPGARSMSWTYAWRRYLDEWVYLRGAVMLYPNFDSRHSSLSTPHRVLLPGTVQDPDVSAAVRQLYQVPLLKQLKIPHLPTWSDLAVLDLFGQSASLAILAQRGADLHYQTSACARTPDDHDPSDLLCPFAHTVKASKNVDKLPTKTVTVFRALETS
ncbi:hypothetical protein BCR43DRAFT_527215 [Syncephalastrum racemosum]|uniref:Uncharacterized protein n=1 Tax=Syncephalastrum racemosum TaxID=13706 RepID=A0A1X2H3E2_SYNRA|nr:hypothetical protein BCR43DRAFT_527215 [Syncephalastrum racemosum]